MSSFIHIVPVCSPGAQIYLIVVPVFAVFVVTVDTNQIMVELALRLTREAQVIEEEYFLPQTRKVLVTTL